MTSGLTRREFVTGIAATVPASLLPHGAGDAGDEEKHVLPLLPAVPSLPALDLSPARWVWYPSGRCLPNTFVLFRRDVLLPAPVRSARGWICADSRYLLRVNGERIQWGPAPSDPRWLEVDPCDLSRTLVQGKNTIGVTALFYGHGDGTWPTGKPGFIFLLDVETADDSHIRVVSDPSWYAHLARCWRAGQYKRWYVRSLQEEFDARLYPEGWDRPGFTPDAGWLPAMPLPDAPATAPPIASAYREYALDIRGQKTDCALRPRSVPLMSEVLVPADRLVETYAVTWIRPPEEYFACLAPDAFTAQPLPPPIEAGKGQWKIPCDGTRGVAATFSFTEEIVGWPFFTIDAPAGTIVELMVQEWHEPGTVPLLNTHYHSWTRFICAEGVNRFETFDYEACRWLQLHIHGTPGTILVGDVGVRRRLYPWKNTPRVDTGDPAIRRLVSASVNTLNNSLHETAMDGVGRERQQYSGDGSHQLHAAYLALGETRLPARFITTFSQGITTEGYFLDCWPAYDRLARLWEREMQISYWGPLLDHSIGFVFDCFHHFMYTGEKADLAEAFPRLLRFFSYLHSRRGTDGLLPVEGLGVPSVYIDHLAYKKQRHKQCAYNLYAAAMAEHALAPLCNWFGERAWEKTARSTARGILDAAIRTFWDADRKVFVANKPWKSEEGETRFCDRSLATSVLFDQCPGGRSRPAVDILASAPPEMGMSYPANSCWRYWALARGGRTDVITSDFRTRWMGMESVARNNTLQEFWTEQPDRGAVMSHCCPVPLYLLYMGFAGIQPLAPGFSRCMIRPQLADVPSLSLVAPTVRGDILFSASGPAGERKISLQLPRGCTGELVVDQRESLPLDPWPHLDEPGLRRYLLAPGTPVEFTLRHS